MRRLLAAAAVLIASPVVAPAQNVTLEQFMAEAAPHMHHSCRTAEETYGADDAALYEVVEAMVAVSLINRKIDLVNDPLTPAEADELWREFADELGDRCANDIDALLAGVIDGIVADLAEFY